MHDLHSIFITTKTQWSKNHLIYFTQAQNGVKFNQQTIHILEFHGICIPLPKANSSICPSGDHVPQGAFHHGTELQRGKQNHTETEI